MSRSIIIHIIPHQYRCKTKLHWVCSGISPHTWGIEALRNQPQMVWDFQEVLHLKAKDFILISAGNWAHIYTHCRAQTQSSQPNHILFELQKGPWLPITYSEKSLPVVIASKWNSNLNTRTSGCKQTRYMHQLQQLQCQHWAIRFCCWCNSLLTLEVHWQLG